MAENAPAAPPQPERIATGVYPLRRRLTLAEAERGALPERFTALEWEDMKIRSQRLHALALNATALHL